MFPPVKSLLLAALVLLLLEQVHSEPPAFSSQDTDNDAISLDDQDGNAGFNGYSRSLQNFLPGETYDYSQIQPYISHLQSSKNQVLFHFQSRFQKLIESRLVIGRYGGANAISSVTFTFHHADGSFLRDGTGRQIEYTSNRHDLGHIVDVLHQRLSYSYARCLIQLEPGSSFDPKDLCFHFSKLPNIGENYQVLVIAGPVLVSTDSVPRNYSIAMNCPFSLTCMWLLDADVISPSPINWLAFIFEARHIGNRTLTYVAYQGGKRITLGSVGLSILPNQDCTPLSRRPRSRWLCAGRMRSARVNFRAVLVPSNQSVLLIGGTADGVTPLASVEVYNLSSGCFGLYNMNYPRMKHTATYFSGQDTVLVIGGQGLSQISLSQLEVLTVFGSANGGPILPGRFSHETGVFNRSTALIVAGQGMVNGSAALHTFIYPNGYYYPVNNAPGQLFYLEGHSVTSTNSTGVVLIVGGYNGNTYPGIAVIYDGGPRTIFNGSVEDDCGVWGPNLFQRAHHRTVYIPFIDAFLVTGGDNGKRAFASCFLLFPGNGSVVQVGSMRVQRTFHAIVLLRNNSVLVMGGAVDMDNGKPMTPTASVERFDLSTLQFTDVQRMNVPSYGHEVVSNDEDEIFLFGGIGCDDTILFRMEYFVCY